MVSRLVQDLPAPCRRNQLRLTWPPHAPIHAAQGFHRGGRTRRAALLTLWDSVERALVRIAVEEAVQPNDAWDDVSCISRVEFTENPKTLPGKRKRKVRCVLLTRLGNNFCGMRRTSLPPELPRQQFMFRGYNALAWPIGCLLMFAPLPSHKPLPF